MSRINPLRPVEREVGRIGDHLLEFFAVLLLGLTTVGTAWCGLQSAKWTGQSSDLTQAASEHQSESSRQFGLATQRVGYDSMVVAKYAEATLDGNTTLVTFYRRAIVRPAFLPVLDRWEASVKAGGTVVGPTEDTAYLAAQFADYNAALAAAQTSDRESKVASDVSNSYVSTTILLAAALFFAGVTSSFRFRPARLLLLVLALVAIGVAGVQLSGLPII